MGEQDPVEGRAEGHFRRSDARKVIRSQSKMKLTKFTRSQRAHRRLAARHKERMRKQDSAWIPAMYHVAVHNAQKKTGKILPRREREIIYNRCVKDYND